MYDRRTPLPPHSPTAASPGGSVGRDASVLVRLDGSVASWDQAAREMFGWQPQDVVGLPFCTLFTHDFGDAVDALWRATSSNPMRQRATALDAGGLRFETEITASRTLAVRDGATGFLAIVHDTTEQQAVEAALRACTCARDSASAVSAVGAILARWVPLADLSLEEAESARFSRTNGRSPADALVPLRSDGRVYGTLRVVFSDAGSPTPRIRRLVDAVSAAIGPSLAQTLELEEVSRAMDRLRRIDRLEKEFLALITHDMRTPLAVIAGFASNLRDKWDDLPAAERLEELDAILRNGRSLTRLVEQDLQLALIDADQLPYEITEFDIGAEIDAIVADFVRTAGTRISLRQDRPLPLVFADPQRNAQVLANLLSNAVKFSPDGGLVEVEAFQRSSMVHVSVRDHGRGVSRSDAAKLFRKFSRVAAPGGTDVPGTGLGLYLCKCMVEAQGGRIWVESSPGRGATFTYTLPVS